ncbi:MAG: GatB/YqeY domain-containing protein [Acidobacteriota bacterium]
MSTPREQVQEDLKDALRSGEKERLGTLRMLLTEIKNEAIRRGDEVDDEGFTALLRKGIKQRREAAEQYRKGGRAELADKEEREIGHLEVYLPEQAGEEEIRKVITEIIAAGDLAGPKAMGVVMKETLARLGSRADGGTVSKLAREILNG